MKRALRRNGRSDEMYKCGKSIIWGVNGVAVARHGPILKDNEATGARKVFRYPRGLRDTIKKSKKVVRIQKSKNPAFYRIF